MKKIQPENKGRRRFLTDLGVVATGATLATSVQAAQPGENDRQAFVPAHHDIDTWFDKAGVMHRVFVDSATTLGGGTALNYVSNIFLGHGDAYHGQDQDFAIIVCFRHQSTPFGYNDAMWEKYGEQLSAYMNFRDTANDNAIWRQNPMNLERGDFWNRGNTLSMISGRGVSFAVCSKATRTISGIIARSVGSTEEAIFQELSANNIPHSRFVPAGVIAVTRSQEYGYSLLYAG